jgi:uncharacterized protein
LIRKNLLDLNVLIALTDSLHTHFQVAQSWFASSGRSSWGLCPFTEAGFIRVSTNPAIYAGTRTLDQAIAAIQMLKSRPGYFYWPITESWTTLTAPFTSRISGHQQVTDSFLLGLAIKEDGVLVTFDRGLKYLAGAQFRQNLLVLEAH